MRIMLAVCQCIIPIIVVIAILLSIIVVVLYEQYRRRCSKCKRAWALEYRSHTYRYQSNGYLWQGYPNGIYENKTRHRRCRYCRLREMKTWDGKDPEPKGWMQDII